MELTKKLQIPPGTPIFLINAPEEIQLGDAKISKKLDSTVAVLLFAETSKTLSNSSSKPAITSAQADRLSWIAYPKAGQLATDLNRDKLVAALAPQNIEGVRLVSIDEVWSAMRFRPKKIK
jgi:hypothetical protein